MTKTLRPNVRRINSERCFTGCGRVTQQPGAPRGGRQGGHFPQRLHSRKPGQEPVNLSSSPICLLGDVERRANFLTSLGLLVSFANMKCPPAPTGWLWGPKAFHQYLTYPNEQKKIFIHVINTTQNSHCAKIKIIVQCARKNKHIALVSLTAVAMLWVSITSLG